VSGAGETETEGDGRNLSGGEETGENEKKMEEKKGKYFLLSFEQLNLKVDRIDWLFGQLVGLLVIIPFFSSINFFFFDS
jgi:hypothetical protein